MFSTGALLGYASSLGGGRLVDMYNVATTEPLYGAARFVPIHNLMTERVDVPAVANADLYKSHVIDTGPCVNIEFDDVERVEGDNQVSIKFPSMYVEANLNILSRSVVQQGEAVAGLMGTNPLPETGLGTRQFIRNGLTDKKINTIAKQYGDLYSSMTAGKGEERRGGRSLADDLEKLRGFEQSSPLAWFVLDAQLSGFGHLDSRETKRTAELWQFLTASIDRTAVDEIKNRQEENFGDSQIKVKKVVADLIRVSLDWYADDRSPDTLARVGGPRGLPATLDVMENSGLLSNENLKLLKEMREFIDIYSNLHPIITEVQYNVDAKKVKHMIEDIEKKKSIDLIVQALYQSPEMLNVLVTDPVQLFPVCARLGGYMEGGSILNLYSKGEIAPISPNLSDKYEGIIIEKGSVEGEANPYTVIEKANSLMVADVLEEWLRIVNEIEDTHNLKRGSSDISAIFQPDKSGRETSPVDEEESMKELRVAVTIGLFKYTHELTVSIRVASEKIFSRMFGTDYLVGELVSQHADKLTLMMLEKLRSEIGPNVAESSEMVTAILQEEDEKKAKKQNNQLVVELDVILYNIRAVITENMNSMRHLTRGSVEHPSESVIRRARNESAFKAQDTSMRNIVALIAGDITHQSIETRLLTQTQMSAVIANCMHLTTDEGSVEFVIHPLSRLEKIKLTGQTQSPKVIDGYVWSVLKEVAGGAQSEAFFDTVGILLDRMRVAVERGATTVMYIMIGVPVTLFLLVLLRFSSHISTALTMGLSTIAYGGRAVRGTINTTGCVVSSTVGICRRLGVGRYLDAQVRRLEDRQQLRLDGRQQLQLEDNYTPQQRLTGQPQLQLEDNSTPRQERPSLDMSRLARSFGRQRQNVNTGVTDQPPNNQAQGRVVMAQQRQVPSAGVSDGAGVSTLDVSRDVVARTIATFTQIDKVFLDRLIGTRKRPIDDRALSVIKKVKDQLQATNPSAVSALAEINKIPLSKDQRYVLAQFV